MGLQSHEAGRDRMANDSSMKTRKQRGGWIEIEEPAPVSPEEKPAIVAGVSASEVPKSSPLTVDVIHQVIRKFAGALPCDAPLDVTTLSVGKQNHIIEELVQKTERCLS